MNMVDTVVVMAAAYDESLIVASPILLDLASATRPLAPPTVQLIVTGPWQACAEDAGAPW